MTFSKQAFTPSQQSVPEEAPKRYKMCFADWDTPVVRCAKLMQEDYIEVKHLSSGRIKEFQNKTSFGIRTDNIISLTDEDISENKRTVEGKPYKWLAWTNYDRLQKGLPEFKVEDFEIIERSRLNSEFKSVEDAMNTAEMVFASNIKGLKVNMDSDDYCLLISGSSGNYRNAESKTIGYKSKRGDKPIFYQEFKDKVASVYKNKIWWAEGCEAEDLIQHIAKQQEAKFGSDRSKWEYCAAWVDKDCNQIYITHKNYDKFEDGWLEYDKLYCEKTLVAQTISGDPTDTIEGLPNLTNETREHFGLRKSAGVSKDTAEKLLDTCNSKQEMWERAMYAYQQYYGFDKEYKFKDVHGVDQCWTWLDYMQQCYVLVKMQEWAGQVPNLRQYLSEIGVDYTKEVEYGKVEVDMEGLVEKLNTCKETLNTLKEEASKYKSLNKGDLVTKLDNVAKLVSELEGNIGLLEK